jgi:hypothetical protein
MAHLICMTLKRGCQPNDLITALEEILDIPFMLYRRYDLFTHMLLIPHIHHRTYTLLLRAIDQKDICRTIKSYPLRLLHEHKQNLYK